MSIKDVKRFLKEIKPKEPKVTEESKEAVKPKITKPKSVDDFKKSRNNEILSGTSPKKPLP
ncbi:MAG: hypothetical protein LBG58_11920, partial [Planctomycetaceae bacterium]|nr:hypothetical protein [Planctomycetaceae bacterium]